jgi:hypothetical protein
MEELALKRTSPFIESKENSLIDLGRDQNVGRLSKPSCSLQQFFPTLWRRRLAFPRGMAKQTFSVRAHGKARFAQFVSKILKAFLERLKASKIGMLTTTSQSNIEFAEDETNQKRLAWEENAKD